MRKIMSALILIAVAVICNTAYADHVAFNSHMGGVFLGQSNITWSDDGGDYINPYWCKKGTQTGSSDTSYINIPVTLPSNFDYLPAADNIFLSIQVSDKDNTLVELSLAREDASFDGNVSYVDITPTANAAWQEKAAQATDDDYAPGERLRVIVRVTFGAASSWVAISPGRIVYEPQYEYAPPDMSVTIDEGNKYSATNDMLAIGDSWQNTSFSPLTCDTVYVGAGSIGQISEHLDDWTETGYTSVVITAGIASYMVHGHTEQQIKNDLYTLAEKVERRFGVTPIVADLELMKALLAEYHYAKDQYHLNDAGWDRLAEELGID